MNAGPGAPSLGIAFPCRHTFANEANVLVFPSALYSLPLPTQDERAARLFEHYAGMRMTSLAVGNSITERVRTSLSHMVPHGELGLDAVSRVVGKSGRSLQRLLRDEGTSFRKLVDDVRRDAAIQYLKEGELPIAAVAVLLDFSDVSAFHRSFRRWTGETPSAFRMAARASLRQTATVTSTGARTAPARAKCATGTAR